MTTAFRTTALAVAMAAFSCGALADPVVLNFDALGKAAVEANAPIRVQEVDGFFFTGAYAYDTRMLTSKDPEPVGGQSGGYLLNSGRDAKTANIVISLTDPNAAVARGNGADSKFAGQYFESISFSLFSSSDPTVSYTTAKGVLVTTELTKGSTMLLWSFNNALKDIADSDQVTSLVFSAGGGYLGLDDMKITLTDGGNPGGNVPEPASYALVGLALLAAGSASRRRA